MQLECGQSPLWRYSISDFILILVGLTATHQVIDALLDSLGQCECFSQAGYDDNDFPAVEDSGHTDCERHTGNEGDVVIEETRIGEDGIVREGFDTGARCERGAGFLQGGGEVRDIDTTSRRRRVSVVTHVERNMPVLSNTTQE